MARKPRLLKLPGIIGFPEEPWKIAGITKVDWFAHPDHAHLLNHILLAQLLNREAEKDDLPVWVRYPETADDPIVGITREGKGRVENNPTWVSFYQWRESYFDLVRNQRDAAARDAAWASWEKQRRRSIRNRVSR